VETQKGLKFQSMEEEKEKSYLSITGFWIKSNLHTLIPSTNIVLGALL